MTRAVRDAVRADDRLRDVWVEGEVGRVTVSLGRPRATSRSRTSAASSRASGSATTGVRSPFEPRTGPAGGGPRPDRRLRASRASTSSTSSPLQPAGFGDLALRFEAAQGAPAAEGLFDAARKRPLPVRPPVDRPSPRAPTGAVWHDIRNVLARRWPLARVVLVACQVQGEPAPGEHRGGPRPDRALRRPVRGAGRAARGAGRSRSWPAAAARSRTSGRSTTSASSGRSSPTRCPSCAASATRPT